MIYLEILQTKCHIKTPGSISDRSTDLWKTLNVWSTGIKGNAIRLDDSTFVLITTSKATSTSIANKLGYENRQEEEAFELLNRIAQEENETNQPFYKSYLSLPAEKRRIMISKTYVLDSSLHIRELESEIKKKLGYVCKEEHKHLLFQRLEGWWHSMVIECLDTKDQITPIEHSQLADKIDELREQFRNDNLPVDTFLLYTESKLGENDKTFLEQLRLINLSNERKQKAIKEYCSANKQISSWLRDCLLGLNELEYYNDRLIDSWDDRFLAMKENIDESTLEKIKIELGKELYNRILIESKIHIRERCNEPFIMKGCYHKLSNELKVGWHPEFIDKLKPNEDTN